MSRRRPWSTAFVTCAIKGALADLLIQTVVEKREILDWKRNAVFSFYGGYYCGWWQHFLYNIVYLRLFGPSTALSNALRKVAFDSIVHVPFIIFPVYYAYLSLTIGGQKHGDTVEEGLRMYRDELFDINKRYFSVWIPANLLVFTVVPTHFRIGFIASTSFAWLSLVSFITLGEGSVKTLTRRGGDAHDEDTHEKS